MSLTQAETSRPTLNMQRVFDAPRALVWRSTVSATSCSTGSSSKRGENCSTARTLPRSSARAASLMSAKAKAL